jgi:hypothetical protein
MYPKSFVSMTLMLASLCLPGCSSTEERREALTERRDSLNAQLNYATSTHARWYDDPSMDRLYRAMDETDRQLAELEREEVESGTLVQIAARLASGIWDGLATGLSGG